MISMVQKIPAGNGLRVWMTPPVSAKRIRLLRKESDSFSGVDDPGALRVSDGVEKTVTDVYALYNGIPVYYRAYYLVGSAWVASATVSATPAATFMDLSVDPLTVVRDRLELGFQVYVQRGSLQHERDYIPVLTASPQIEDVPLPLVTVHLAADAPDLRFIGELVANDVFSGDEGMWHSFEGGFSRTDLTIVCWSLNADERIVMRNALKTVLLANLPVFDAAGLLQVSWSFSDQEDFTTYAAPVYQAMCNFTCYAPSAVESVDPAIRDVVTTPIF